MPELNSRDRERQRICEEADRRIEAERRIEKMRQHKRYAACLAVCGSLFIIWIWNTLSQSLGLGSMRQNYQAVVSQSSNPSVSGNTHSTYTGTGTGTGNLPISSETLPTPIRRSTPVAAVQNVSTSSDQTHESILKSKATTVKRSSTEAPKHRVIYKPGEYDTRPDWMTQKQWNSYIDWEAKQAGAEQASIQKIEANVTKLLKRHLGSRRVKGVMVVLGAGAARPVDGWIAMVDIYSDQSSVNANERAVIASEVILDAGLNVNRVMVSVYLNQKDEGVSDYCMYCIQADRGEKPDVLQEFTPLR